MQRNNPLNILILQRLGWFGEGWLQRWLQRWLKVEEEVEGEAVAAGVVREGGGGGGVGRLKKKLGYNLNFNNYWGCNWK